MSSEALEAKLVFRVVRVLVTKAASRSKGKSSVRALAVDGWSWLVPLVWAEPDRRVVTMRPM